MTTGMFYAEEQKLKAWKQIVKFFEVAAEKRGLECPAPRQLKEVINAQGFTKTFTDVFKSNASSVHQRLKALYMEGDYPAFVALTRDARRRRVKRLNLSVNVPNIEWAANNSNYYFTDLCDVDSSAIYVSFPGEAAPTRVRVADLYLLHSILYVGG